MKQLFSISFWIKAVTLLLGRLMFLCTGIAARMRRNKVPLIRQTTQADCGAACLTMILNFYGRHLSLRECRKITGVGRDGLNARDIVEAARRLGLRAKAYSLTPENLPNLTLPAILHWGMDHFVVLEKYRRGRVYLVDPSQGRYRPSATQVDEQFTGVALCFEPGVHFEKAPSRETPTWLIYLQQLVRSPGIGRILVQVLAACLLLQILGLAFPILTKVLVDQLIPLRLDSFMPLLGLGILVMVTAQFLVEYLRSLLLLLLQGRLDSQMMLGFFEHTLSLPFRFFQERSSGDLLQRLSSNAALREILTTQSLTAILDGTFVMVYLAILWWRDVPFGIIATLIGCAIMAVLIFSSRRVHDLSHGYLISQAESQSYLVETLNGIETVKACGTESKVLDHWSNLFFKQLNLSLKKGYFISFIDNATKGLRQFAPLALLWFGTFRVLEGQMSLGTMLALLAIGNAFLAPLASLVASGQQFQMVAAHLERIAEVWEAQPEQTGRAPSQNNTLSGALKLDGVSFRYHDKGPLVLRDINLAIKPGQKMAIVGATGSGKSTLAKLMLGLYSASQGELLFDDCPLSQLNLRELRQQIGVVPQNTFLFSGSIRNNIAIGQPDLPLEQVIEAARLAAIHHEISALPMGYDTPVGEGGTSFSGGQRQRLALARALVRKPAILLLDEATSHLDSITEQTIEVNLAGLTCTRIVIAHRLSTVRDADLIVVLERGCIVEQGTHDALLNRNGPYRRLVAQQNNERPVAQSPRMLADTGIRI